MSKYHADNIVALIDLTSLNDDDTPEHIAQFVTKAKNSAGSVAAVCIYPHLIKAARKGLEDAGISGVNIATVVNFPDAQDSPADVVKQTKQAISDGAQEIDVVLPYHALLDGNEHEAHQLLAAVCKETHSHGLLVKVILETGALESKENIIRASEIAIDAGADFLKTSTGKIDVGATLEAADAMLETISAKKAADKVGIKISGGVRSEKDAQDYLELIESRMGDQWVNAKHVRIGASSLLDQLLSNN